MESRRLINYPVPNFDARTGRWIMAAPVTILYDQYGRAMAISGAYTGASYQKRSMSAWNPAPRDADSALSYDITILQNRSQDLLRNSPLAVGAVNTTLTNVVGSGLKFQSRIDRKVLNMEDDQANEWEENTEREWRLWADSQDCDIARTLTFDGYCELAFRKTLEDGDVFVLMPMEEIQNSPYSLRLQMIEAARVCNEGNTSNSDTLFMGVEKKTTGAPIRYHILNQNPYASWSRKAREWTKVTAFNENTGLRNVIHLFKPLRPGQTRGIPWLTPVIETIKQLDRYTEAEIMAAVVSGFFTVLLKHGQGGGLGFGNMIGDQAVTGFASGNPQDESLKLANGAIVDLPADTEAQFADPTRPNSTFDPFVKAILEQIGTALGIPFEILIGHFSASYSASRAALIQAWMFFLCRRLWLARIFCQPIYENFLSESVAIGRTAAPGFFKDPMIRKAYCGNPDSQWIGDSMPQIDPLKEADAAVVKINNGLSTVDRETTSLGGGDFQDNQAQIRKERIFIKEVGLPGSVKSPGFAQEAAAAP